MKGSIAIYKNGSWHHKTKVLLDEGRIKQGMLGGFETEKDAEDSYYRYKEQFEKDYHRYLLSHEINKDIMFDDYLIFWFNHTFSKRVETTTRMCKAYVLNDILLPNIRDDIKLMYVNSEYLNALLEQAAKMTESAGNAARELLFLAFKDAVAEGYVRANPVLDTTVYKRKKPNIRILNKEEIKVLLKAASKEKWYLEILLCLFCGLRKGEVLGLKFSDFDLKEKTVKICRQLGKNYSFDNNNRVTKAEFVERNPKTDNSFRVLRVPDVVIREVEKRRTLVGLEKDMMEELYHDNDYVSCQKNGKPHSASAFNIALTKLCKRNGLTVISVHSLRHMYATILLEQEVPLAKISALLGHASVHTTFEYYCEVMDEKEKIAAYMNDTFSEENGEVKNEKE